MFNIAQCSLKKNQLQLFCSSVIKRCLRETESYRAIPRKKMIFIVHKKLRTVWTYFPCQVKKPTNEINTRRVYLLEIIINKPEVDFYYHELSA